uniref:Uncharacterized protein n=1 Tax=Arundo donax TaxID=35708 RepID=A0A0A9I1H1_ARUDO
MHPGICSSSPHSPHHMANKIMVTDSQALAQRQQHLKFPQKGHSSISEIVASHHILSPLLTQLFKPAQASENRLWIVREQTPLLQIFHCSL